MKRVVPVLVSIAAALLALPQAGLSQHRHQHNHRPSEPETALSFNGTCQLSGTVAFKPALTTTPQPVRDFAEAEGPCSGTVTDRHGHSHQLDGDAVRYVATDEGSSVSCAGGVSTGHGVLVLPWGVLRFALNEARATGGAALSRSGRRGGSAHGDATISASENPVAILQQCASAGLARVGVDINVATTPTISG